MAGAKIDKQEKETAVFVSKLICGIRMEPLGEKQCERKQNFHYYLCRQLKGGGMEISMYDLLSFIDSVEVREYNVDTYFTPAEWAVIVGLSITRIVEEKIEALRYLVDHYDERCFEEESANMEPRTYGYKMLMPSRSVAVKTINVWEAVLQERYQKKGSIYAAKLLEKAEYVDYSMEHYRFFHSYDKAFAYLLEKNQEFECGEFPVAGIYGQIECLNMDNGSCNDARNDCYLFDQDLRLVDVWADVNMWKREEDGSYTSLLNEPEYPVYVPLPFKKGDIIKVENLLCRTFYGVMSCDWRPTKSGQTVYMDLPLEFYIEGAGDFDYTDGGSHDILRASVCPEEKLPEDQQALKLISDVHKGKLDFQVLLHKFGRKKLEGLYGFL